MVSDRPTRPLGVVERFRQLTAENRNYVRAHPELRLRLEVADFLVLSARQRYQDLAFDTTVSQFWTAWFALREPKQHLTHSDFEDRSIACVRQLHPLIDGYAERHPAADPLDVEDGLRRLLVDVPPLVELTERYEDHPHDRSAVAEEITAVLTRFLEVAPWPVA